MKRTDITKLFPDATDEQINALMDLNGSDINAAKRGVDELKAQLTATKADLENSQKAATAAASADELKKAQELGVQIISEEDFEKMISG